MIQNSLKEFENAFGSYQNEICMIYGPAGTGKTTIAQLACLDVVQAGYKAIFLDSEGGFSVERFKQIAGTNFQAYLERIFVIRLNNFQEQHKKICALVNLARNFKLIVVDTIGAHFRKEYKNDVHGLTRDLENQIRVLSEVSRNVPVIITNQVYSTMDGGTNMIGSSQVKQWCARMIRLEKSPRRIVQERPRFYATQFTIEDKGISLTQEITGNPHQEVPKTRA